MRVNDAQAYPCAFPLVLISAMGSLLMAGLIAIVGGAVYLAVGIIEGISIGQGLRLLHFIGVMYATLVIIGLPRAAQMATPPSSGENRIDQAAGGQAG